MNEKKRKDRYRMLRKIGNKIVSEYIHLPVDVRNHTDSHVRRVSNMGKRAKPFLQKQREIGKRKFMEILKQQSARALHGREKVVK